MSGVGDDEALYRSVDPQYCSDRPDEKVTSAAFLDPGNEPSVDRAHLCPKDKGALHTKRDASHGVVLLHAYEVRRIKSVVRSSPDITYAVDVKPDPIETNDAHALVVLDPSEVNRGAFKKLRIALARIANCYPWQIRPSHYAS